MTLLIGNKEIIAIEYVVADPESRMGHGRLWFEGQPLGSLEDLIYFDGYLLGCLQDLQKKPPLTDRYRGTDKHRLFHALYDDLCSYDEDDSKDFSETAWPYNLTCGTLFDCYSVFAYRQDDEQGRILWRLEGDRENLFNDLKHASRDVHVADFSYERLRVLASEFENALRDASTA